MISLCSVILDELDKYIEIFTKSIFKHLDLVKEIVLIKIDSKYSAIEEEQTNNKTIKTIHCNYRDKMAFGHALGLHEGINYSEQPYIMFSDPDLFFCNKVDEIYINLLTENKLNYIGCSHHAALSQAYNYFPHFVSSLISKQDLPDEHFLEGKLRFKTDLKVGNLKEENDYDVAPNGKYLLQCPIADLWQQFPNTEGLYDIGCNLWIWAQQKNWRWLAFQTLDCHNYNTLYHRENFKLSKKIPKNKLLYHGINGSRNRPEEWANFEKMYKELDDD